MHRSGSNSVKGDRQTSTKLEPLLAGPLITETPKLQAVSANTSAGDKFLHLGLKDQTTKFAEQVLPFRQRHAHLICCKPRDPPIEPANLDRLHLSPAVSGLELDHPLHDRLLPYGRADLPNPALRRPEFFRSSHFETEIDSRGVEGGNCLRPYGLEPSECTSRGRAKATIDLIVPSGVDIVIGIGSYG